MKGRKIDIHSIKTGEKIMFKSQGKDYLGAMTQRQIRRNMSFEKNLKGFYFWKDQSISDSLTPTISGKIIWECNKVCLKFALSPYTMLRTNNIDWRKLYSLFLNIVKGRKGRKTQYCPNSCFSHNFCHWLSEKSAKF